MNLNQRFSLFASLLIWASVTSANEVKVNWLSDTDSQTWAVAKDFIERGSPLSDKTTLLYETEIIFDDDLVTKTVRQIDYFPTYNEAHSDGNESIYWDKEVESLTIMEARVLDHQGQSHRLIPSNIRVIDSDSYNTFTDQKEVILPYSGLQNNSLSILEYKITFSLSDLESPWSSIIYPVMFDPVKHFHLKVVEDKRTPITWLDNVKNIIDCEAKGTELVCNGFDLKANKSDKNVIWRDVLPQILIGETRTWEQVISHNLKAFDKARNKSDSVQELLAGLTNEEMTQEQKIGAIHQFVSRDIRYISMSELGHRITPHTSASVIKNRFGDCKDKSALLHGLLNLIGIKAKPVLVATQRSDLSNTRLPNGGYFDHMVICFDLDNRRYCLDPTDANTDYESISSWIQGKVALDLELGAKPTHIPKSKHRWWIDVSTNQKFDENANVYETQQRTYHTAYASLIRNSLAAKNEKERNDLVLESYHNVVSTLVDPTFKYLGLTEMSEKLEIHSEASYPAFLDPDEPLNYVEYDAWVKSELADLEISTKHHDATVHGLKIRSLVNFDFSKLWSVNWYPATLSLKGKYGEMTRTVEKTGEDQIKVETTVTISAQTIKKDQIASFNKFLKLLKTEAAMSFDGKIILEE